MGFQPIPTGDGVFLGEVPCGDKPLVMHGAFHGEFPIGNFLGVFKQLLLFLRFGLGVCHHRNGKSRQEKQNGEGDSCSALAGE